jgi:16S rRNA (cytosine967-C5)-methyltransferase
MFLYIRHNIIYAITILFLTTSSIIYPIEGLQQNRKQKKQHQVQQKNNNQNNVRAICTARSTAIFALLESLKKQQVFAIRVLENDPSYQHMDRRDRAFSRLLLSTTERRSGQIEKILNSFIVSRRLQKKDTFSRSNNRRNSQNLSNMLCEAALRIGVTQILFLDIPQYAAVDETVEVLRLHPHIKVSQPQINFVNGVLRNVGREGRAKLQDTTIMDNVDPWLAQQWIETYGQEVTNIIVSSAMTQSPIFLSINHRRLNGNNTDDDSDGSERIKKVKQLFSRSVQEKVAENGEFVDDENNDSISLPELLPTGSIRVPTNFGGSVSEWPGYKEGLWWVQDPSATLPALALWYGIIANNNNRPPSVDDVSKMHVVDLCSAPGGKCAQLCSMGFGRVDAVEISPQRSNALQQNLKRLGMDDVCHVTVADGRQWAVPSITSTHGTTTSNRIDGILLDAPCSATGVGSRQPDVLRKNVNLSELVVIQRELLTHATDNLLSVGGVLVYATCSLLKQEGEDQIEWLLNREKADTATTGTMELLPLLPGEIPGFDDCIDSKKGWLRVIPGILPGSLKYCDGFFVARLKKKERVVANDDE